MLKQISYVLKKKPLLVKIGRWTQYPAVYLYKAVNYIKKDWLVTPEIINNTFYFKYYDNSKAKRELNWKPDANIYETLEKAKNYYLKNNML